MEMKTILFVLHSKAHTSRASKSVSASQLTELLALTSLLDGIVAWMLAGPVLTLLLVLAMACVIISTCGDYLALSKDASIASDTHFINLTST